MIGCTGKGSLPFGESGRRGPVTQPADIDIKQVTEQMMTYAAGEPERAMEVIDSLRTEGLPVYQADLLRVRVYSQGLEGKMLDSAIVIGERLMEQPVAKENQGYREDLLEALVNACRLRHDFERAIRWSGELVTLCHEKGEETEALRNEAEVGLFLTHVGRSQEGLAKIDSVLTRLDGVRRFNELDAWTIAAKRKITVLKELSVGSGEFAIRQQEIIPVAHSIIDRLTDYEQHPDDYRDGTYREPSDEDRQGYIDFYRTQAYCYMAEAYARNGDSQKARECLEKFEQSDYGQTLDGRKMITPTWCLLGETQKMEAMYEDLTTARFRDYEQKMEIERQKAVASRNALIVWFVAVLSLLLACFGVYYFLRHREETRKNRILVQQITEALTVKEQLKAEREQARATLKEKQQTVTPPVDATDLSILSDIELFHHLSNAIERDQLFLDPNCDRQMLTERFSLPKERIGNAFVRGGGYNNVSAYINTLRLDYAAQMLTDRTDLDVSQVAQASGFSSHRYFSTCFKQRFGLSPSDYREASKSI